MQIEDGTGHSYKVKVSNENMIASSCVSQSDQHHVNHTHGDMYSVMIDQVPDGNDACFLYIKNTDDKDLLITSARIGVNDACEIYFKLGDTGTPVDGTDSTPGNRNAGSGNLADCTCQVGTDITGLAGGWEIDRLYFTEATSSAKTEWDSYIIVPKNNIFTAYCFAGGSGDSVNVIMTLAMFFHEKV